MTWHRVWFALAAIAGPAGCARWTTPSPNPNAVADVLWLPPQAVVEHDLARPVVIRKGRSVYVDGSGAVVFSLPIGCDVFARQIDGHFENTEWQRRSTRYLNPQLATSFNSGCKAPGGGGVPVDSKGAPVFAEPYQEWWGEWENGHGDIVGYAVGGQGQRLRGYASYVPRHNVDNGLSRFGR
jgi:hypothetical protein